VLTPDADNLIGQTIGSYVIGARIGGGGMGVVYQARDIKLGRTVALKFLPPQWSHDEDARQRFFREAQAASATNHPSICTIHDIATAPDGQLFIVMAYYEGQTLKQRLASGRLAVDEALDIATQIADGLAKAHAQGVVHRDMKPGNVILTEDGARIVDFGLATFADALKLTVEHSTLGTAAYMSPEQVRGLAADARSDVWAVGVMLYEMLTGHVPFQGSHAEAIAYAIRSETPPPIRASRREVGEEVEQLVFRALHKEASVRFKDGRDLARGLRQVRGQSLPLDLRTQPVPAPKPVLPISGGEKRWAWKRLAMAAGLALALVASLTTWVLWPAERVPVAVTPALNQTGFKDLDGYSLAFAEELTSQLVDVTNVRVLPHDRLLQILRRFRQAGRDVFSREALQAIAMHSGARVLLVPTLLQENGGWKVRLEFRNPTTGVNEGTYETPPEVTSLWKDALYKQTTVLPAEVFEHFRATGPARASIAALLRGWMGYGYETVSTRLLTPDAAMLFEQGIDAYEQLEYARARAAFTAAAARDPRNPVPWAWRSRTAALMRQDNDAVAAADEARRLLSGETREGDRLLVEAVAAEARRDTATAEDRYRRLVARYPDEPGWLIELGGFQDRQGLSGDAVNTYHAALSLDDRLVRPHLELCRLYSPSRVNEPALARRHGEQASAVYAALGNRGGEAQAHLCLADALVGGVGEEGEARRHAESALAIMRALQYPFGLARTKNYLANVAFHEGKAAEAAALWEETLSAARVVEFALLESRTLMNLGVAYKELGKRPAALKYLRESATSSEALGVQQDAAWTQVNIAVILIEYGENPEEGLRLAKNALVVFEKLSDKNFEVVARRAIAIYDRNIGKHEEAMRELTLAQDVARSHDLEESATRMRLELARVQFDRNDYAGARDVLLDVEKRTSGLDRVQARTDLARARARLGEFDAAREDLTRALDEIEAIGDVGSLPLFHAARGELAFESGDVPGARTHFAAASALWTDDLPEAASVEGRAYLGLLDAQGGQLDRARKAVTASLKQARQMQRRSLEARCQIVLARIDVQAGRFEQALATLEEISAEREATLDSELRAQLHYWRSRALQGRGDARTSEVENTTAHKFIEELRGRLPESVWSTVRLRSDIRLISGDTQTNPATH
jgi:tetratricopeptide (TPR) repeat protein